MASNVSAVTSSERTDSKESGDVIRTSSNLTVLREKFEPRKFKSPELKDLEAVAREMRSLSEKINTMHSDLKELKAHVLEKISVSSILSENRFERPDAMNTYRPSRLRPNISDRVSALLEKNPDKV